MKKTSVIIALVFAISLVSCGTVSKMETPSRENVILATKLVQEKETEDEFLTKVGYYDLMLNPKKKPKNWQGFDLAYREALSNVEYKKSEHYSSIKIYFTQSIVLFFNLLEDTSKEAQEAQLFYFNEMKSLEVHNLKASYVLAQKLKNKLSDREIKEFADNVLTKNASLIHKSKIFLEENKNMSEKQKRSHSTKNERIEYAEKLAKIQ